MFSCHYFKTWHVVISYQLSVISYQLSVISYQLSVLFKDADFSSYCDATAHLNNNINQFN
ncbi:MAG TPA: hypothetical protein DCM38_04720 [Gammaproteobacteria bacterium]|nr:hypothetical protein [Gammaproteobacteria bacterium]